MSQRLIGQLIGNRYRLIHHMSEGGYGNVYKAVDTQLNDQVVAVKLLRSPPPDMDQAYYHQLQRRFMDEARVSVMLGEHPSIVKVISYGVYEQRPYLVMEHLNAQPLTGRGLDAVLSSEKRLVPERVVRLAVEICAGLHYAHNFHVNLGRHSIKGVIHRDIKPSNIFVIRKAKQQERIKLLDFGISKVMSDATGGGLTQSGYFLGTMCYASPEQMRGESLDPRSDIYSLGVLLYELLTGVLPLIPPNDTLPGWYHVHNYEKPHPFREHVLPYAIPEALQAVILACLEKNPDQRPQTMQQLSNQLQSAVASLDAFAPESVVSAAYQELDTELEPEFRTEPHRVTQIATQQGERQFQKACHLIEQSQYKQAIHYLNDLIRLEPNEYRYYLQRGLAHLRQGDWGLAQVDFQGALRLEPDSLEAKQGLQDAMQRRGAQSSAQVPAVKMPEHPTIEDPLSSLKALTLEAEPPRIIHWGYWMQWVGANAAGHWLAALGGGLLSQYTNLQESLLIFAAANASLLGASVGTAQWLVLRGKLAGIRGWPLLTALGYTGVTVIFWRCVPPCGSHFFDLLAVFSFPSLGLALGLVVGGLQTGLIYRQFRGNLLWILVTSLEFVLAATVTSLVIQANLPPELLLALIPLINCRPFTGLLLLWLLNPDILPFRSR
ncbi:MAG: protein kinase [Synechococcaceae cyanobacterium SM2_3_1]|nr:protein kinase [Synechococcaceae cyanobacterium SM2_3_1]